MNYDLVDLRVFLAVLEEGHLSRGAQRCNLAPSSVSARLRSLEDCLGVTLLDRRAKGVIATPAGAVLAEHARRFIAQLEQMHADLSPFTQGVTGRVILFANTNAISSFLPEDLGRFFKVHPSVRITMEERNSSNIVAAVADNRADLGVVALEGEHPLLDYFPYKTDELVLLAPREHPLATREKVRFAECLDFPFISLLQGAAIHTFLVRHATDLGRRLDVRVQVSGYPAIGRLVGSGAGVGLVPRSAVSERDALVTRILELDEPWARRDLHICVRKERAPNYHRDELLKVLTRV